ncbi:hypothetical protein GCM10020000_49280 [Streptomyces olivoverticillatus]
MDAQGRGRAGDIDPADQWVFDPDTGSYELRLDHAEEPSAPGTTPPLRRPRPLLAPLSEHRAPPS